MIRLNTLGTVDLRRRDGSVVHSVLQQPKRTALLIYLAMGDGAYRRRDSLLALFWPEASESSARHSLSQALYKLREALGANVIATRGDDDVSLTLGSVDCDAVSLRNAAGEGDHEKVLALFRGDFLAGFHLDSLREFTAWCDAERSQLRELVAHSSWLYAQTQLVGGNHAEAYRSATRAFELDPANEPAARAFMDDLATAGEAAAALTLYQHVEKVLFDQLDAAPAQATQAIARGLESHGRVRGEAPLTPVPIGPPSSPTEAEPRKSSRYASAQSSASDRLQSRRRLIAPLIIFFVILASAWAIKEVRSSPPRGASVAVLPLENLARDPKQDYFVDGMYNALIGELGEASAVRVVPRTSASRFQATAPIATVARELGVDAVVRGGVLRIDDSVIVNAHLIAAKNQVELWSASYRRGLSDVPSIYADIARAVASEVEVRLTRRDVRTSAQQSVNPAAYDAWLQGSFYSRRRSGSDLSQCFRYARQAVAVDPTYAPGYELLAECYNLSTFVNSSPPGEMFEGAKRAARHAISIDGTLAAAHAALAYAQAHYDWDWAEAEESYRHALQLNPSLVSAEEDLAWLLSWSGRFEEALEHARRAEQLDPFSPQAALRVSMILTFARRYDEAIAEANRAIGLDSTYMFAYDRLHWAYYGKHQPTQALAAAQRALALSGPNDIRRAAFLAHAYANANQSGQARAILDQILNLQDKVYVSPGSLAIVYAALGEKGVALDWLERAYEGRDGDLVLLKVFGVWDPLRNESRFKSVLARMRFPK